MSDDAWAEAHSRLITALEIAFDVGMTREEIEDAIDNVDPDFETEYAPGKPKSKKPT